MSDAATAIDPRQESDAAILTALRAHARSPLVVGGGAGSPWQGGGSLASGTLPIAQREAAGRSRIQSIHLREQAMPKSIISRFQKEYGKKHGKEVYYATANKEGRDPENFHKRRKAPASKGKLLK